MSNDSRGLPTTLRAVAEAVEGRVRGDESIRVAGVRSPTEAGPNDLAFVSEARYLVELEGSAAAAVLVDETLDEHLDQSWASILVADAQAALVTVLERLHPAAPSVPGIHPTAVIGRGAEIAEEVTVGPYAIVGDHARIGAGTVLNAHVVVSRGCRIGRECTLHPHVVLYEEVELGDRVVLHSGARIGIDGFGYVPSGDGVRKLPHHGPCVIGDDVEIGANACVDRASLDRTEVGTSTKLDNLVHIGHNVRIGEGTMMAALVGIAGSVRIGAGTQWGGQSGAVDHQVVGDGAKIAGKTGVSSEVEAGQTVMGFPSRPHREHMKALAGLYKLDELHDRVRALEQKLNGGEGATQSAEDVG